MTEDIKCILSAAKKNVCVGGECIFKTKEDVNAI